MARLFRGSFTALIVAVLLVRPAFAAPPTQDTQAIITSPTDGQQVSGVVPIFGTATSTDFARYELAFGTDPNPNDAWQTFATADIILSNAQIGAWDTTTLPPGRYMLRLRVVRSDSNYAETFVRGLQVGPTASPTSAATPTNVPPAPTFGIEPAATIQPNATIELPPTATPTPQAGAAGSAQDSTPPEREQSSGFDLSNFGAACLNGVWCAVGLYLLLGAYVFGRWGFRLIMKQVRRTTASRDE
jgi:hypothetical protein